MKLLKIKAFEMHKLIVNKEASGIYAQLLPAVLWKETKFHFWKY